MYAWEKEKLVDSKLSDLSARVSRIEDAFGELLDASKNVIGKQTVDKEAFRRFRDRVREMLAEKGM